jgi:dTDP-4-amino-4,6-dideoxygalactose transaminase
MLALRSAGIGAGDEVIVPANTFVASAFAVEHAGATPVLCDVSDEDGLIDAREAESVITPSTAAVMAVHLYGQVCNMGPLRELAARHDLLLVEDAAQAHGAIGSDGKAGALGDVAAFSFYPGKNLGALGDAGAICTDDTEIADAARQLRDLGRTSHGLHEKVGYNERLDGIQAAFLRVKLEDLDEANEKRRRLAYLYRALLPDTVRTLPDKREGSVHHLFPIRNTARDSLRESLAASGIQTGVHYSPALHRQPALAGLGDPDGYPNATAWAAEELSLPLYPELSESGARRVAEEVSVNAR